MAPISQRNLLNDFDRFSRDHGQKSVAGLRADHVEALLAKKAATPAAANKLLKLVGRLCRFAIKRGLITIDPTAGIRRYAENPDGFHTWTVAEIEKFETYHGLGSKPVLALRLGLCTGAARRDLIGLGWHNINGRRIAYRRGKTGGDVDLPIIEDLSDVLDNLPTDRLTFLAHGSDRPYKPETLGNWFREQCLAAGLPHCSLHGLRKAGATRLADAGATEFEIMAFLGHRTPDEARTYTKKANRKTLADSGMEKLLKARRLRILSNL
jgi:integrase